MPDVESDQTPRSPQAIRFEKTGTSETHAGWLTNNKAALQFSFLYLNFRSLNTSSSSSSSSNFWNSKNLWFFHTKSKDVFWSNSQRLAHGGTHHLSKFSCFTFVVAEANRLNFEKKTDTLQIDKSAENFIIFKKWRQMAYYMCNNFLFLLNLIWQVPKQPKFLQLCVFLLLYNKRLERIVNWFLTKDTTVARWEIGDTKLCSPHKLKRGKKKHPNSRLTGKPISIFLERMHHQVSLEFVPTRSREINPETTKKNTNLEAITWHPEGVGKITPMDPKLSWQTEISKGEASDVQLGPTRFWMTLGRFAIHINRVSQWRIDLSIYVYIYIHIWVVIFANLRWTLEKKMIQVAALIHFGRIFLRNLNMMRIFTL